MYIRNSITRKIYHILKRDTNFCLLNRNGTGVFRFKGTNKDCEPEDCDQVPEKHKKKSKFILWGKEEPQLGPTGKPIGIMDCIKHAPAIREEDSEKNEKEEEGNKPDGPCRSPCEPREECKAQEQKAKGTKPHKEIEGKKVVQQQVSPKKESTTPTHDSKEQKQNAEKKDQSKVQSKEKEATAKDKKDCPPCPDVKADGTKPSTEPKTSKKEDAKPPAEQKTLKKEEVKSHQQLLTPKEEKALFKHPLVKKVEEAKKEFKSQEMQQTPESKGKKEQLKSNKKEAAPPKKDDCPPCPHGKPEENQKKEKSPSPPQKTTRKDESICPPPLKQQKQLAKSEDKDPKKAGTPTTPKKVEKPPTPTKIEKIVPPLCLKHAPSKIKPTTCVKSKPPAMPKPTSPKEKQFPFAPKIGKSSNFEKKSSSQKKEKDKKDVKQQVCPPCKSKKADEKNVEKTVPPLCFKHASSKTDSTCVKSKPAIPSKETNKSEQLAVKKDQKKALSTEKKEEKSSSKEQTSSSAKEAKKDKEVCPPCKPDKTEDKSQGNKEDKAPEKKPSICPPPLKQLSKEEQSPKKVDTKPEQSAKPKPPPLTSKQKAPIKKDTLSVNVEQKSCDSKSVTKSQSKGKKSELERFCVKNFPNEGSKEKAKPKVKEETSAKNVSVDSKQISPSIKEPSEDKKICPPCKPKGKRPSQRRPKKKAPPKEEPTCSSKPKSKEKEPVTSRVTEICKTMQAEMAAKQKRKKRKRGSQRCSPCAKRKVPEPPEESKACEQQIKQPNEEEKKGCNVTQKFITIYENPFPIKEIRTSYWVILGGRTELRNKDNYWPNTNSVFEKLQGFFAPMFLFSSGNNKPTDIPPDDSNKDRLKSNALNRIRSEINKYKKFLSKSNQEPKIPTQVKIPQPMLRNLSKEQNIKEDQANIKQLKAQQAILYDYIKYLRDTASIMTRREKLKKRTIKKSNSKQKSSSKVILTANKDLAEETINTKSQKVTNVTQKSAKDSTIKPETKKIVKNLIQLKQPIIKEDLSKNSKSNISSVQMESMSTPAIISAQNAQQNSDHPNNSTVELLIKSVVEEKPNHLENNISPVEMQSTHVPEKPKRNMQQSDLPNQTTLQITEMKATSDGTAVEPTTKSTVAEIPKPLVNDAVINASSIQIESTAASEKSEQAVQLPDLPNQTTLQITEIKATPDDTVVKPTTESTATEIPNPLVNNTSPVELQSNAASEKSEQIVQQSDLPNQPTLQITSIKTTSDGTVVEPPTKSTVAEIPRSLGNDVVINASSVEMKSTAASEKSEQAVQLADLANQTTVQITETKTTSSDTVVEPITKSTATEIPNPLVNNTSPVELQSNAASEKSEQIVQQSDLPNQPTLQITSIKTTSDGTVVEPPTKSTVAEIPRSLGNDVVINASSVEMKSTAASEKSEQAVQLADLANQTTVQITETKTTSSDTVVEPITKSTATEIPNPLVNNTSPVELQSNAASEKSEQIVQQSDLPNQPTLQITPIKATSDGTVVEPPTKSTVAEIPRSLGNDVVINASSVEMKSTAASEKSEQAVQLADLANQTTVQITETKTTSSDTVVEPITKSTATEIPNPLVNNTSPVELQSNAASEKSEQIVQQSDLPNQPTLQITPIKATSDGTVVEPPTKPTVADIPRSLGNDAVINASSVEIKSTAASEKPEQTVQLPDFPNQTTVQITETKTTSIDTVVEPTTESTVAEISRPLVNDVINDLSVEMPSVAASTKSEQTVQLPELPNQTTVQITETKATSSGTVVEPITKSNATEIPNPLVNNTSPVELQSNSASKKSEQTVQLPESPNQTTVQITETKTTSSDTVVEPTTKSTVTEILNPLVNNTSPVELQSNAASEKSDQIVQQSDLPNQPTLQITSIKATSDGTVVEPPTKPTVADIPRSLGNDAVINASSVEMKSTAASKKSAQDVQLPDLPNQPTDQITPIKATSDDTVVDPSTKPTVAEIPRSLVNDAVNASTVEMKSTAASKKSEQIVQLPDLPNQPTLQITEIKATPDDTVVEPSSKSTVEEIPRPLVNDVVINASSVEMTSTAAPEKSAQDVQKSELTESRTDNTKDLEKLEDKASVAVLRASDNSTHIVMLNKITPVLPNISLHGSDNIAVIEMELTTPESAQKLKLSEIINQTTNEADGTKTEEKSVSLIADASRRSVHEVEISKADQAARELNNSENIISAAEIKSSSPSSENLQQSETGKLIEKPTDLVVDYSNTTSTQQIQASSTQGQSAVHEIGEIKELDKKSVNLVVEAPNKDPNEGISKASTISNRSENDNKSVQIPANSQREESAHNLHAPDLDNTITKPIGEVAQQHKKSAELDHQTNNLIAHIRSANNEEEVQNAKQVVTNTEDNISGSPMIPEILKELRQTIREQSGTAYFNYLDKPSVIKEEIMTETDKFVAENEKKVEANPKAAELPSISEKQHPDITLTQISSKVANIQVGEETNLKNENIASLDLKANQPENINNNLKLATNTMKEMVHVVKQIAKKPHKKKEESDDIVLRISSLTPIIDTHTTRHLPNDVEDAIASANEQSSNTKQITTPSKEQTVDLVNQTQHVTEGTRNTRKNTSDIDKSSNDQQIESHPLAKSKDAAEKTKNLLDESDDISSMFHLLVPIEEAQPKLQEQADQVKKTSGAIEEIKNLHKKSNDLKVEPINEHVVRPSQQAEKIETKVESTEDMQKRASPKIQESSKTKNGESIQVTAMVKKIENNIVADETDNVMDQSDRKMNENNGAVKSDDPSKKHQKDLEPSSQCLKQTADILIHASGKPKGNVSAADNPIIQGESQPSSKCLQQTAALLSLASEKAKDILLDLKNVSKQKSKRINSTSLCLQQAAILLNQLSKKSNNYFPESSSELKPGDPNVAGDPSSKCLQQTAALLSKASENTILHQTLLKAKINKSLLDFTTTARATDTMERIVMDMCILFSKYFKLTSYMLNSVPVDPHLSQAMESEGFAAKLQNMAIFQKEQKNSELSVLLSKYLKLTSNLMKQSPSLKKSFGHHINAVQAAKKEKSDSLEVKEPAKESDQFSVELWALFSKYLRLTADLIEYVLKQSKLAEVTQIDPNASYIVHTTDSERIAPSETATNPNKWRPLIKYVQLTSDLVNQISKDFKMIRVPEPRTCPSTLSERAKSEKKHQEALEYFNVSSNNNKQKEDVNSSIKRIPPFSNIHNKEWLNLVDLQNDIDNSWQQCLQTSDPNLSTNENKIVEVNANPTQVENGRKSQLQGKVEIIEKPLAFRNQILGESAPNAMQQMLQAFDQEVIAEIWQADMILKKKKSKTEVTFQEKTHIEATCSLKPPHVKSECEFSKEWLEFVANCNLEMEAQSLVDLEKQKQLANKATDVKDNKENSPKMMYTLEPQKKKDMENKTDKNKERDDSKKEKSSRSGEAVDSSDNIHPKKGFPISHYIKDEEPRNNS